LTRSHDEVAGPELAIEATRLFEKCLLHFGAKMKTLCSAPQTEQVDVLSFAISESRLLCDWLAAEGYPEPLAESFDSLSEMIEALPLTIDRRHHCFMRNWVAGSRDLLLSGESGAARYQVQQVARLLQRISQSFVQLLSESGKSSQAFLSRTTIA
jgi:hypothetical protein